MNAVAAGIAVALATHTVWLGLAAAVLLLLAPRVRLSETIWTLAFAIGAGGLAIAGALGTPLEGLLPLFLVGLLVHFTARDPQVHVASLLVGLLLVVAAVRSTSPWFVIALLAWCGSLAGDRGRRRLLLPIGVVSVGLFMVLPRFGTFLHDDEDASALTGFDGDVELGALGDLLDDPARVFTARFSSPPEGTVYFRGVALDRFDGRRWWSEASRTREPDYDAPPPDSVRVWIELEPHPEGVLFVPGTVDGLDTDGLAIDRDTAGAYHLPGPPRPIAYTAFVQAPYGPGRGDPFLDAEPRVDLPASLSARTRALFIEQGGDATTPQARMDALTRWLQAGYTYTRAPRDADPEAPLEFFLETGQEGHCEYFASALAVGGRALGIPTRVINGFVGGEPTGPDTLVLRRYHAHSWVEYFDGDRWVLADATPGRGAPAAPSVAYQTLEAATDVWNDLLTYDGEAQIAGATGVAARVAPFTPPDTRPLVGALILGCLVGALALVIRLVVRPRKLASTAHGDGVTAELKRLLYRLHGEVEPGIPDLDRASAIAARLPEARAPLEELVWLSYGVRYGGADPTAALVRARQLVAIVDAVRSADAGSSRAGDRG